MAETVYGTHEDGHVMSEKVQSLASTVYKEFERMIKKYDEDVVKELMPLVVGILESLDNAYLEKQETEVELELLREDNEQLLTQYEREKQLRKAAEQKFFEMEDSVEGEKKELVDKVESLESIVRMLELKAKNAADHVSRLEEKESEMKKEYNKLHERYTELFKTHMDYMERTKILMGTDKLSELTANSPRIKGIQLPHLRPISLIYGGSETPGRGDGGPVPFDPATPQSGHESNVSLRSELSDADSPEKAKAGPRADVRSDRTDKEQVTDSINVTERSTGTAENPEKATIVPSPNMGAPEEQNAAAARDRPADASATEPKTETVTAEIEQEKLGKEKPAPPTPTQQSKSKESDFMRSVSTEDGYQDDPIPTGLQRTLVDIVATTPELDDDVAESFDSQSSRDKRKSVRNDNSIFEELSMQGPDTIAEVDFGADITGREVNPADYASSDSDDNDNDRENDKESTVSDNFFGMGKELENLILENTELLATKNALNIVKDDLIAKVDELSSEQEILREEITSLQAVKGRLQLRITQLEEDLKKMKEELEKKNQAAKDEEEGDVPMAQRKRFTRVEMARVLMERNQYKERLMELQEAVRWTEMIRASREHPELSAKKKSSIWNFFSNLFSSSNKPKRPAAAMATVRYNAPTTQVQPVGDPNKKQREKYNTAQREKAFDFLQEDVMSEKTKKEREKERQEQYKRVRAHVKKDDGRMQAYGWSLPAKFQPHIPREQPARSHISVPVPVYCRPLCDKELGVKMWCAAGVNLTGGRTRDGGSIVGASIFYSSPPVDDQDNRTETKDDVEKLNQELKEHEKNLKGTEQEQMSSLVWICTSEQNTSRVYVIDANNPADILDSFRVSSTHILCIASVPGATESDYPVAEEILKAEAPPLPKETVVTAGTTANTTSSGEVTGIGEVTFVQCTTGPSSSQEGSPLSSPRASKEMTPNLEDSLSLGKRDSEIATGDSSMEGSQAGSRSSMESAQRSNGADPLGATSLENVQATVFSAKGSPPSSGRATPTSVGSGTRLQDPSELVQDGTGGGVSGSELQKEDMTKMSSVLPTMWMGSQSGSLYVHSSVAQWKRCLHSVKLRDSILSIVHLKGRVLVALADGTVAIFHRALDGQWDLQNYHLLDLGKPHHSIRCMTVIAGKHVWCGYKNKIHIIDPKTMSIEKTFDAHPRKESQVRQLSWVGDGVWVSIRLDSTLRLYHAYTHQHLQDVDIEPYVSKMLGTGKLGFSFVRITAMLISCNRLWIGTGNGVIISVPLSEKNKQAVTAPSSSGGRPGGVIRVYSDSKTDSVTPGSFIPYCSMAQAQLSFHGHRDAVKFFTAVPGTGQKPLDLQGLARKGMSAAAEAESKEAAAITGQLEAVAAPQTNTKLVLSGGEGYVDFRLGDGDEDESLLQEEEKKATDLNKVDHSHLIVWQITSPD